MIRLIRLPACPTRENGDEVGLKEWGKERKKDKSC